MNLAQLKIKTKLVILSTFLIVAAMAIGLIGWLSLNQAESHLTRQVARAATLQQSVDLARKAQVGFKVQIQEWKNILLRGGDPAAFDKYRKAFISEGARVQDTFKQLETALQSGGLSTSMVRESSAALRELETRYLDALGGFEAGAPDAAQRVDAQVRGMDRVPEKKIDEIVQVVTAQSREIMRQEQEMVAVDHRRAMNLMSATIIIAVLIAMALTVWITTSISRPLDEAVRIAEAVAQGDLTLKIDARGNDETGLLLAALRSMNDSLVRMVTEVRTGTEAIAAGASQIAQGNLDLSARTESQAGTLEETASSMEELTSTVRSNADNAQHANELAAAASGVVARGGETMREAVQTMALISESSRRIADIVGVIDGVAFQTNILALNASVEAARAGEHGQGFAVVAEEVRSLAQRSAASAREIKALIEDAAQRIDAGSRLVSDAGQAMEQVVGSVREVTAIMGEIMRASQEQSHGILQVNQAVGQLDQATQQNAALVEQAAAAARAMDEQAARLAATVSQFSM